MNEPFLHFYGSDGNVRAEVRLDVRERPGRMRVHCNVYLVGGPHLLSYDAADLVEAAAWIGLPGPGSSIQEMIRAPSGAVAFALRDALGQAIRAEGTAAAERGP